MACATARPAQAQTTAPAPRDAILVTVAGGNDEARRALVDVLRERLDEGGGRSTFESAARVDPAQVVTPGELRPDVLARLWVDMSAAERVTLYVVDGAWERVLVRHVPQQANPEIAREEVGHIVALAVAALRSGERIGIGREAARDELRASGDLTASGPAAVAAAPEPTRPPAAPPPSTRPEAHASIFGAGSLVGAGGSHWLGVGGALALVARRGPHRFGVTATLEYRAPSDAGTSEPVRLEGGAVHALPGYARALGAHGELGVLAGAGIAIAHASIASPAGSIELEQSRNTATISVRALARYAHDLSFARVFVAPGVDIPTRRTRYVVDGDTGPRVLFEGWTARPVLLLGLETP